MNSDKHSKRFVLLQHVERIAAVFLVMFGMLLLVNFLLTKNQDPLNTTAMQQLLNRLAENPQDEALREQVRNLDLLARKAFFTRQWQIRTGCVMLLAAALIWWLAAKTKKTCTRKMIDPALAGKIPEAQNEKSTRFLLGSGLVFVMLSLLAGFSSHHALRFPPTTGTQKQAEQAELTSEIQITAELNTVNPAARAAEPPSTPAANAKTVPVMAEKQSTPTPEKPAAGTMATPERQWPAFRGPHCNGHATYTNAPTVWDGRSGKNIKWKSAIPLSGFNSPIIWGKRLFISGGDATQREVYCYHTDDGKLLWRTPAPTATEKIPHVAKDTGFAASTMTTDGERIFAVFATGDVACLDFNGRILWSKGLGVPDNHYGHSSSLITWQNLLYVQYDDANAGRLLALKTGSGDIAWEQSRQVQVSWTSPILARVGNAMQVIINANPIVAGYDAATGKELWSHESVTGEPAPSPVVSDQRVFVVNEYSRLAAIALFPAVKLLWETDEDLAEVSSPLVSGELLFVATSGGTVTCRNAATGEKYWSQDFDTGFYASPVLCGDRIYLLDRDGLMHIFKSTASYQWIADNSLGESSNCSGAFMDGCIFLRSEKNLYCIAD
jgi:outer membrane protein assembly factor BamB